MALGHLTNGQFFQKYRFAQLRPPSDFDVVCHGKLIASCRQPETFYNGWYPVRHQCSFPEHVTRPGAGLKSESGMQFRNYRLICDICDHPDNRLPPVKEKSYWSSPMSGRNSVAPKLCEPTLPADVAVEPGTRYRNKVDAYWRYHDPHDVEPVAGLPGESRVHGSNWFKQQMARENKYKLDKQVYQRCQQQLHLLRESPTHAPPPASQRKHCQRQAKLSISAAPQPADNVVETPNANLL